MLSEILMSDNNQTTAGDVVKRLNYNFHNLSVRKQDLVTVAKPSDSEFSNNQSQLLMYGSLESKVSPEMISEWNLIGEKLCRVLDREYSNPVDSFQSSLRAFKIAKSQTAEYKNKYFDYIHKKYNSEIDLDFKHFIKVTENSLELNRRISLSCLIFFKNVLKSRTPLNQVESVNNHIYHLINHVVDFVFYKELLKTSVYQLVTFIDDASNPYVLSEIYNLSPKKREKYKFEATCEKLKKNAEIIRFYSCHLRQTLDPLTFEDETIYFSPNSAEGKAIRRLEKISDDEMVTLVERGQEIDVDGALERLKKRGYKVEI